MNEAALDAELSLPQYAGLSDQQAADAVMAKTVPVRTPVDAERVQETASLNGSWGVLKIAALKSDLSDPPRGACLAFIDWVESGRPLNFDNPAVQQMAGTLVSFSLLTAAQVAELSGLADTLARWVDVNGVGDVGIGAVRNSRKRIGAVANAI